MKRLFPILLLLISLNTNAQLCGYIDSSLSTIIDKFHAVHRPGTNMYEYDGGDIYKAFEILNDKCFGYIMTIKDGVDDDFIKSILLLIKRDSKYITKDEWLLKRGGNDIKILYSKLTESSRFMFIKTNR